jgi:uncharacterized membrane protein YeaQ/YmgE (transglycosylase-associated protein family)
LNIPIWVVMGAVIGALAKFVMPKGGIVIPIILGTVGSVAGGIGGKYAGFYDSGGPGTAGGLMLAVMGAFTLVGAYVTIAGGQTGK